MRAIRASVGPRRSAATPKRSRSSTGRYDPAHDVAVLDDVAEDVGDLQGHAEGVGEGLGLARDRSVPYTPRLSRPMLPATRRQ